MGKDYPCVIHREPGLQSSSLVVGWIEDAGNLAVKVTDYLNAKLGGVEFGEVEPVDFFPMSGVSVEDDIAHFPESKFYSCPQYNLVIFKSNAPQSAWYEFLGSVLDVAEHYCHAKEIYTVGGMVTYSAHTAPRELLAVTNSPKLKRTLREYDIDTEMDYETPPGQRPTLSSFLLWVAQRRGIPGASLWVPVPFYLVSTEDPPACRRTLEFLDKRLGCGIDFRDLDEEVASHNQKIAEARSRFSEIDESIRKLETHVPLTQEESERLVREIQRILKYGDRS